MFEVAELGQSVDKSEYKARVPALRVGLLQVQQRLRRADFPVLVLVSGVDGAGKGDTVNLLNAWMDPRYIRAHAFGERTDEERERPPYWRFWRALPPRGNIGLYIGSWYSDPIAQRVDDAITDVELDASLMRIRNFERALVDDGAVVVKFWLHLSKEAQKNRLKSLMANPDTAWRVTERDRKHLKHYDTFRAVAERTLRETSTAEAPWIIVEGRDARYRDLTVGEHLLERLTAALAGTGNAGTAAAPLTPRTHDSRNILETLDLSKALDKKTYRRQLTDHRERLGRLARKARQKGVSTIMVFEGWDAAGKGGIIRRIVPALDARDYQVIPVAAPTDEERAHHYLWRFWRHIPRAGKVTVYDRSWYGRVLVERVEGYADEAQWSRAYAEINDFEEQLHDHGIVLLKFWIHVSKDEQLRRFEQREQVPWKQHKITEEDYRNREKWDSYARAVNDMVERTSTEYAPWTLVEGNDKRFARIKALRTCCERLEKAL